MPQIDTAWAMPALLSLLPGFGGDYLLVACRMFGLVVLLPGLHSVGLTLHTRCLIWLLLALLITPNVSPNVRGLEQSPHHTSDRSVGVWRIDLAERPVASETDSSDDRSDENRAGEQSEITRVSTADALRRDVTGRGLRDKLRSDEAALSPSGAARPSLIERMTSEILLGLLLGWGAFLLLQGLRMAGQLIDHQMGWGPLETSWSDTHAGGGSLTGDLMFGLGAVVLLALGGHLILVSTVLETFRQIPVGTFLVDAGVLRSAAGVFRLSLGVALQVSAPLLATQVLVSFWLNQIATFVPWLQSAGIITPVRMLLAVAVLYVTLAGFTDQILGYLTADVQAVL